MGRSNDTVKVTIRDSKGAMGTKPLPLEVLGPNYLSPSATTGFQR